jgi:hypothetical protein
MDAKPNLLAVGALMLLAVISWRALVRLLR